MMVSAGLAKFVKNDEERFGELFQSLVVGYWLLIAYNSRSA